jgi:hypothetical protein
MYITIPGMYSFTKFHEYRAGVIDVLSTLSRTQIYLKNYPGRAQINRGSNGYITIFMGLSI